MSRQPISTSAAVHCFLASLAATFAFIWTGNVLAQGITFSVGPDQTLSYPSNLKDLSDEHTTILPPALGSNAYLFFSASAVAGATGGAVVLQTTDLINFTAASGYPAQVMTPAIGFNACKASFDPQFDLNYAAPGSVVQDPTLPAGNLIMIYEAENHCPGALHQQPYYATVGFARSSDNGKTWPAPVDSEFGGPNRHPILKSPIAESTTPVTNPVSQGNAIPSAIVATNAMQESYLYIVFQDSDPGNDGMLRMARAKLGASGQISLFKWFNGGYTEPGIGGQDSAVLPSRGCIGRQNMGQISYSDTLGLYVMLFVCIDAKAGVSYQGAWYFSTATSLDLQDWTPPQMVGGSLYPATPACASDGSGGAFDGWYPSLMSPNTASGHIINTGFIFFMNGCDTGTRQFMSRSFTIAKQAPAGSSPQSGIWWNPAEGGRGYTVEYNGKSLFMAAYLYDVSGRSHWYGAGPALMGGATFSAPLTAYSGGQTLTGNYKSPTQGSSPGNISVTFSDTTHGTLTWPGGTIPIQRFEFVTNGLANPPTATQPQTGWWWNANEGGRGFSVEVQASNAFIATYMYDNGGNPVWYASGPAALVNNVYQGTWTAYTGGQILLGTYQPPTGTINAGTLTVQFASPTAGTLTLPNGRQIPIQRFSF